MLHTANKRNSLDDVHDWKDIMTDIREEPVLYRLWENYVAENKYIGELAFHEVLDTADEVAKLLGF